LCKLSNHITLLLHPDVTCEFYVFVQDFSHCSGDIAIGAGGLITDALPSLHSCGKCETNQEKKNQASDERFKEPKTNFRRSVRRNMSLMETTSDCLSICDITASKLLVGFVTVSYNTTLQLSCPSSTIFVKIDAVTAVHLLRI
jgi:hypothetical protein